MGKESPLVKIRLEKLEALRNAGIDPYPYTYSQTHHASEVNLKYASLEKEEQTTDHVSVAGRIMQFRSMGKIAFAHIQDQTGRVQLYFRENDLGPEKYSILKKIDLGDIIGAEGHVFKTRMGEVTVYVSGFKVLSKAILPLPEKFHGLKDEEIRYRKRYLDLIANPEVKDVFVKRAAIIDSVREVLKKKGFLEVETPLLQTQYGGGNAKPFRTHINAFSMDMFLSISPELFLKRLLVGGYEKVFTICKNFRNEGVDRSHNPEFTMLEAYEAYTDYEGMMGLIEEIFESACLRIHGKTKISVRDKMLDFKRPWKRISMKDALAVHAGIDPDKLSDEELFELRTTYNISYEGDLTRGKMIQLLFEELAEPKLDGPIHVIDHPKESTPLCKKHKKDDELIDRFESYILGVEITNGYSELNDPVIQRSLLEEQARQLRGGDEEAHPMDEDFVEAIETGMPPAGGVGLGIDRMVMFLTDSKSIRDILFFPIMKPEMEENDEKCGAESGKEKPSEKCNEKHKEKHPEKPKGKLLENPGEKPKEKRNEKA